MTKIKASYVVSLLGCLFSATAALAQTAPVQGPPGAPETTVMVNQFRFTGNSALSSAELASVLKMFPGRSLTMEQLNRAAEEVQALYRSKGWFLARAYLPAQSPKDGVIDIAVLEGRIDKVTVNVAPGAPISAAAAQAIANTHLHSGEPITEKNVEEPLLLLRDVPRVSAKSVLEPGSTVGTANIAINVETEPSLDVISGRFELDNYGTRATGRGRLTGEINVNNPWGIGDQLSLRAFIANAHGNTFGRASYTLPVGPYGTRIGASAAHLSYQLGEEFAALNPTGVANVTSLNASHPIIRSKNTNLLAQLVFENKKLQDEIEVLQSSETSTLRSATFSLSGDWRDSPVTANQVTVAVGHGKLSFDDPLRIASDQAPGFGLQQAGTFTKTTLMARRVHQLTPDLQGMLVFNAQAANKNLPGAEKFALGGSSSVRAFPIGEVIGDQGYSLTMEFQYALPASSSACSNSAIGFYDFGRATINHSTPAAWTGFTKRAIGGPGIGYNIDCSNGLMLRLSVATPAQGDQPGSGGTRAWIMAGYGF